VTIVCLGDSITMQSYHTGAKQAYSDMLSIVLKRVYPKARLTIVNAGISGDSTRESLARLERDVLRHEPDLVTVMLGMNDIHQMDAGTYYGNLRQIVQRCQESTAEVLLCTPNPTFNDSSRPAEKWEAFVAAVRCIGQEANAAVADCYTVYKAIHDNDPRAYQLMMSDGAHPNMNGHKVFAEEIAYAIGGQRVSVQDVRPPAPAISQTLMRQTHGTSLKIMAMPPYDEMITPALNALPLRLARPEVIRWPAGQSLTEMRNWAQDNVRSQRPDLVIIAVPAEVAIGNEAQFISAYQWLLNWSLDFGPGTWDCVAVLPSVTKPSLSPEERAAENLAREVISAGHVSMIERPAGESADAQDVLTRWVREQYDAWPGPSTRALQ
jgi:lysophospholipase L1-like esterase